MSSKRNLTRSGNPAVPRPPRLSVMAGSLALVSDRHETPQPPDDGGHRWVVVASHQVDPARREFYLSEATLVQADGPRCSACGQAYGPDTASGFCPGVEQG